MKTKQSNKNEQKATYPRYSRDTNRGSCLDRKGIVTWDCTELHAVYCLHNAVIWDTTSMVS